jgi:hypothetical protein
MNDGLEWGCLNLELVSDFDIRISDFNQGGEWIHH